MNLHEIYQTLLRRGMPGHPRLKVATWHGDSPSGAVWLTMWGEPPEPWLEMLVNGFWQKVTDDDASDMITMHALRWCLKKVATKSASFNWCEWPTSRSKRSFDICNEDFIGECDIDASGTTILEAILAATEHLEPK